jgi:hypothetical protein
MVVVVVVGPVVVVTVVVVGPVVVVEVGGKLALLGRGPTHPW